MIGKPCEQVQHTLSGMDPICRQKYLPGKYPMFLRRTPATNTALDVSVGQLLVPLPHVMIFQ